MGFVCKSSELFYIRKIIFYFFVNTQKKTWTIHFFCRRKLKKTKDSLIQFHTQLTLLGILGR